jgi:hypothetical protein
MRFKIIAMATLIEALAIYQTSAYPPRYGEHVGVEDMGIEGATMVEGSIETVRESDATMAEEGLSNSLPGEVETY